MRGTSTERAHPPVQMLRAMLSLSNISAVALKTAGLKNRAGRAGSHDVTTATVTASFPVVGELNRYTSYTNNVSNETIYRKKLSNVCLFFSFCRIEDNGIYYMG